jgi:aryl carrier-like protein
VNRIVPQAPHLRTTSLTEADIRAATAAELGLPAEEIASDDDLFELGLDSLRLIKLASSWRRLGLEVGFDTLAETPTVAAWHRLLTTGATTPAAAEPAATPLVDDERFPLGLMQHAYWIGRQEGQPLGGVGAHFYVEFDGHAVEPDRLRTALTLLRRRHAMLRTLILDDGTQRVRPAAEITDDLVVHDLRTLGDDELRIRLDRLRDTGTHRRMRVEDGEVFIVELSLLPGGATRLPRACGCS